MSRRREEDQARTAIKESPEVFRRALHIDTDRGPRSLDEVLDPWQRQDFEALDDACRAIVGQPVEPKHLRAWLERPRGHDKTGGISVVVLWLMFASERALTGIAVAADQDQARLLRDAISRLTRLNIWLTDAFDVQRDKIVNRHTGSTLTIISADAPSAYGLTPDFVVADEVTHWGTSQELWTAVSSAVAKKPLCLFLCICNAGFIGSWQWQIRETVRELPGWYFHALDGPQASWITPEKLEEQRRLLPLVAYNRLWLNQWSTGSGDALSEDDIKAAVTIPGPLAEPEKGWAYVLSVDLGLKRDAAALVVLGVDVGYYEEVEQERPRRTPAQRYMGLHGANSIDAQDEDLRYYGGSGRFRLAALHLWHPSGTGKVSIEPIEAAILRYYQSFGLACVGCDPWQAAYLIERLQKQELPVEAVDFTGGNLKTMASVLLDGFNQRQIDLYNHPQLLADLRALRVEEKSYGVRLTSPRGPNGHGDAATALAIALLIAKRFGGGGPTRISGPLVCWP